MRTALIIAFALSLSHGAPAFAAERLTDPQLMRLMENIDDGYHRWREVLDHRDIDEAVLRTPAGRVDVHQFLEDFEDDIERVKGRLGDRYAAGPEVTALLRRASDVERGFLARGSSPHSWKTLSADFSMLAATYGVAWPIGAASMAQRKTDHELAADAERIADAMDALRSGALEAADDADVPERARQAAERQMHALEDVAEHLDADLEEHRGRASDAAHLLDLAAKVVSFARSVSPMRNEATWALRAVENAAQAFAVAFRMPWPSGETRR